MKMTDVKFATVFLGTEAMAADVREALKSQFELGWEIKETHYMGREADKGLELLVVLVRYDELKRGRPAKEDA